MEWKGNQKGSGETQTIQGDYGPVAAMERLNRASRQLEFNA